MSQLGTFQEYYDYWQSVATSHVDITGFKFGDREVINCAARSNMSACELWCENYDPVSMIDNFSDNHTGQLQGSLVIMKPDPEKFSDQRTVVGECEQIVKDILGKILKEFNEATLMAELRRYKYGEAEIHTGATKMRGVRLDFVFLRPERLVYTAAKWA
jgi:hypothetical protein